MQITKESLLNGRNRRNFLKNLGMGAATVGAAAALPKANAQTTSTYTDFDILNFALNLEYLEAEFYAYATSGAGIDAAGVSFAGSGNSGATTGGSQVTFTDPFTQQTASETAADELSHVVFLQSAIASYGGTAIAKPAINLNALGMGFGSQAEFLTLARIFEDIGVTAYGGAAPLIVNSTILGYAARILATEAEHVGNIRLLIFQQQIPTTALDGADIIPPPSGSKLYSNDAQALTEVRTPQEVLFLAYGGVANATSGGFFPSGVNGLFNTSAASAATGDLSTLTASPNPIPVSAAGADGVTTISWNAPNSSVIEIHVGSPTGPLFTRNTGSGSMATGAWVTNGLTFYLQDVGAAGVASASNTLATLTVMTTVSATVNPS